MSTYKNKTSKTLFLQIERHTIELVRIPPGRFSMGSIRGLPLEKPIHHVVIGQPFFFGKFLITQKQWQAAMHENPSEFTGNPRLPVESINWDDAKRFCKKLSEIAELQVRLPTEAEWEYACQAGTSDEFYFSGKEQDVGEYAWYDLNSGERTHPVGLKKPNTWDYYHFWTIFRPLCVLAR